METKKISKWDAAPESIKEMHDIITGVCDVLIDYDDDNKCEKMMVDALSKVLDDYNELEAKYQEACGMISEYEEENRNLKSELDIKTDECDALISRVFKQDEEYTELKKKNKELRETRELLNEVNSKQCAEVDDLEADIRDLEVQVRVNKGIASLYESEIKQVIDLAKSYGLIIYDDRKDAISDDVKNIGMCGHYYVLDGSVKGESKDIQNLEKKWKNAENNIKELIQVLNYEHIDVSRTKNLATGEITSWTIHNYALSEKTKHFDIQLNSLREINHELREANDNLTNENDDLKKENNNLITDNKRLSNAVETWFDMFNDMRHKRDFLKKEYEKLKEKLKDKNKLIYKLTPRKGNAGNKSVPPTGCCGCCTICTLKDICWILND